MHSIMNPQGLNIARPPCCPRLPPGSGLREVSAGALRSVCLPPALDLSSSPRHNQSAPELLSLPACCCAREQTQLFLLSGTLESSIHPALAAACPRQLAGFLEHLP